MTREYYKNYKEEILAYQKEYNKNHKEEISAYQKEYGKNHKKERSIYLKDRLKNNIQAKLALYLRSRLNKALKGNYKTGSAVRDLGCSIACLKIHLENQFEPGMSWKNWGNKKGYWSIDHIIPLSSVDLTNREQFLKICHYNNLRPLWHIENIKKGSKIIKKAVSKK